MVLIMTGPVLGGSVRQLPERQGGHSTLRISEDDIQKTGYSPDHCLPRGWPQALPITATLAGLRRL